MLDDCIKIGLGRGLRMELSVELKLETEVLEGARRSSLRTLASSLMRAMSSGNGGKITSGTFPDAWLQRLVDLARTCGRSG
jgi:hypothetical protein